MVKECTDVALSTYNAVWRRVLIGRSEYEDGQIPIRVVNSQETLLEKLTGA